jgi:hypothetical protein
LLLSLYIDPHVIFIFFIVSMLAPSLLRVDEEDPPYASVLWLLPTTTWPPPNVAAVVEEKDSVSPVY